MKMKNYSYQVFNYMKLIKRIYIYSVTYAIQSTLQQRSTGLMFSHWGQKGEKVPKALGQ